MDKKHCAGCYNDDYNRGLGGAKECWSLADAKLGNNWLLISVDARPPYDRSATVTLPYCYTRERFTKITPGQLTREGYWKS